MCVLEQMTFAEGTKQANSALLDGSIDLARHCKKYLSQLGGVVVTINCRSMSFRDTTNKLQY